MKEVLLVIFFAGLTGCATLAPLSGTKSGQPPAQTASATGSSQAGGDTASPSATSSADPASSGGAKDGAVTINLPPGPTYSN